MTLTTLYDWLLEWKLRASLDDPFFTSLQNSDPESWQLLLKLGGHFLKRLIAVLLASNGFSLSPSLHPLIQGGFTSLCVQDIFGSGKTYTVSLSFLSLFPSCCLRFFQICRLLPQLKILDLLRDAYARFWLTAFLSSLQSTFSRSTARSSFNLTLPSCVLSLPTALFCLISTPKSEPFLRSVGLQSMMNHRWSRRFHLSCYLSRPCVPPDLHCRSQANPCRDRW